MKKIVVGIDGSRDSFNSYKCASTVFLDEDISLTSVFVRDERKTQIPFIYSGAAYDIAYERLYVPVDPQLAKTYEKVKVENKLFAEKCIKMCENIELGARFKKSGIILEGDPVEELLEISKNFDLLVLGQRGENASYARELIGSTSEDVIRKSLVPVLICPGDSVDLKRILIVYEDSLSSENALNYYIKYLSVRNTHLTILVKEHFDEISTGFFDKIMKFNTTERQVSIEHCKGSLAHRAIEVMEEGAVDTFVLGSHGKHKLAEYLLGSVTIHIIRKSSLPVFIVH